MKITEYAQATAFGDTSILLTDGVDGTKKILTKDAIFSMLDQVSPEVHRMIFRGKSLGASLTNDQKTAISNGTFKDIFLGDYWTISGVTYRVADFDYWLRCGDVDFTKHHLVLVPDAPMYNHVMNDEAKTEGGYMLSKMKTEGLTEAKSKITAAFGANLLTHKEYFVNATTAGRPSGRIWVESDVDLMNEKMVYGTHVFSPVSDGTNVPGNWTIDKSQLALFQAVPRFIHNRATYWLRDVVSWAHFASVGSIGNANYHAASTSLGVRPAFAIGV